MDLRKYGMTRDQLRQGSQGPGGGNGDDHVDELTGSRDLTIYLTPNRRLKGYAELKAFVEARGCRIGQVEGDRLLPGKEYTAVKVSCADGLIPEAVLRRAHRWAHQRNYLHSFFKPLGSGAG